jgi:hypothetical protein
MRKLSYLFATAALGGLALSISPASASPLASGLAAGVTGSEINEGLVQKVRVALPETVWLVPWSQVVAPASARLR